MNCPKCNFSIKKNALICPNCKKVLNLKCPKCGAVGKSSICVECNHVILNKCFRCGKLNPTSLDVCPICSMNLVASIALKKATIYQFAALSIEILNFDEIQEAFDNKKTLNRFKDNIFSLINNIADPLGVMVQNVGNVFILRFCVDETYRESCMSAINFALNFIQSILELNQKLESLVGTSLKIKTVVFKADNAVNAGSFNETRHVNILSTNNDHFNAFSDFKLLIDSYIQEVIQDRYPYKIFNSIFIGTHMVSLYEILIEQVLKLPDKTKEKQKPVDLPIEMDYRFVEEKSNLPLVNFSQKHCSFLRATFDNLQDKIVEVLNKKIPNTIISVKDSDNLGKLHSLDKGQLGKQLKEYSIYNLCCLKRIKYEPFGFLRAIIKTFYEVNDFYLFLNRNAKSQAASMIKENFLVDLLCLSRPIKISNDDLRYKLVDYFSAFFRSLPKNTLFIIDDFENIDDGSLDVLKYLIEKNTLGNINFIVSCNDALSLHRTIPKLINSKSYFELELKQSSNKEIIAKYHSRIKNVEESFFVRKVIKNMKGSEFYFREALDYLCENKILHKAGEIYSASEAKMFLVPQDINDLIKKKLSNLLTQEKVAQVFFTLLVLGDMVPLGVIRLIEPNEYKNLVKILEGKGFIEVYKNEYIVIKNYNLYVNNFLQFANQKTMLPIIEQVNKNIVAKMVINNPIKAICFEYANAQKEAFKLWKNLSEICLLNGDIASYHNCCERFLSILDDTIDDNNEDNSLIFKLETYEQISKLLYKDYPEKTINYLKVLIEKAERSNDDSKVKTLSNLIVQCYLNIGNYTNALDYLGKVISRTPLGSLNPESENFNIKYYLTNFVSIELYFNLGQMQECIDKGSEIIDVINADNISSFIPKGFSKEIFKESVRDTKVFILLAGIIQLQPDIKEQTEKFIELNIDDSLIFELLLEIHKFITSGCTDVFSKIAKVEQRVKESDSLTQIIFYLLKVLTCIKSKNWQDVGNFSHQAKQISNKSKNYQFEMFFDLLIGLAYKNINNMSKANVIYYNVLKHSIERGLKNITYLCWYLIVDLELSRNNLKTAFGVINNAMLNIEKDVSAGKLMLLLFKSLLSEALLMQKNIEQAVFCKEQVFDMSLKAGLKYQADKTGKQLFELYSFLATDKNDQDLIEGYENKLERITALMHLPQD